MLILVRFHLLLTRVTREDIEEIRQGRNLDHVRLQHLYQEHITKEEQEAWFDKVDNRWNYFFIIRTHGKKVGLVYVKDFTEGMASSTCGVFIWDQDSLSSRVPILAILTVLDFFFGELRGQGTESIVLRRNTAAMKMNEFFGFAFEDTEDPERVRIRMDLERYLRQRERLLKFAARVVKDPTARDLVLGGEVDERNFDIINDRLRALRARPARRC